MRARLFLTAALLFPNAAFCSDQAPKSIEELDAALKARADERPRPPCADRNSAKCRAELHRIADEVERMILDLQDPSKNPVVIPCDAAAPLPCSVRHLDQKDGYVDKEGFDDSVRRYLPQLRKDILGGELESKLWAEEAWPAATIILGPLLFPPIKANYVKPLYMGQTYYFGGASSHWPPVRRDVIPQGMPAYRAAPLLDTLDAIRERLPKESERLYTKWERFWHNPLEY